MLAIIGLGTAVAGLLTGQVWLATLGGTMVAVALMCGTSTPASRQTKLPRD